MADFAYESWVGSDTIINGVASGSSWDICFLGTTPLPGVVTVENMEIGRDIDVQKRKKKEKARIKDNGLSPVTFDIIVEITGRQWIEWLKMLPVLQPKQGEPRQAFTVTHPMLNAYGVQIIYIHKIKCPAPSARKGMRVEIHCGEWIEEVKDVPPKGKVPAVAPGASRDALGNPADVAAGFAKRQAALDPSAYDNVLSNAFDAPPPDPLPGEPGWRGFRNGSQLGDGTDLTKKPPPRAPDYSLIPTAL